MSLVTIKTEDLRTAEKDRLPFGLQWYRSPKTCSSIGFNCHACGILLTSFLA
jgi:hypothetical protein